jgi:hypothetical protein
VRGAKKGDASSRARWKQARKVETPGEQRLHSTRDRGEGGKHGWLCERKPPQRRCQANGPGKKTHGRIIRGKPGVGRKAGGKL